MVFVLYFYCTTRSLVRTYFQWIYSINRMRLDILGVSVDENRNLSDLGQGISYADGSRSLEATQDWDGSYKAKWI